MFASNQGTVEFFKCNICASILPGNKEGISLVMMLIKIKKFKNSLHLCMWRMHIPLVGLLVGQFCEISCRIFQCCHIFVQFLTVDTNNLKLKISWKNEIKLILFENKTMSSTTKRKSSNFTYSVMRWSKFPIHKRRSLESISFCYFYFWKKRNINFLMRSFERKFIANGNCSTTYTCLRIIAHFFLLLMNFVTFL